MIHKVYKITNLINDYIYIGVTKDTLENRLKQHSKARSEIGKAIREFGKENFKIEEIHSFESKEESYNKEAEIVNETFLGRADVYNAKKGGHGGFDYINTNKLNKKNHDYTALCRKMMHLSIKKLKYLREYDPIWVEKDSIRRSESLKEQYKNGRTPPFKGKSHSNETKKQMSESHKGKHDGSNNSQFGTMWISNFELEESKKIPTTREIPEGWVKGRNAWNSVKKKEQNKLEKLANKKARKEKHLLKQKIILDIIKTKHYTSINDLFNQLKEDNIWNKSEECLRLLVKTI